MSEKGKGLLVNYIVYTAAFAVGLIPFLKIREMFAAEAAFTVTATLVIYLVSVFFRDTSLYDPYWSVAPPVMLLIRLSGQYTDAAAASQAEGEKRLRAELL